MKKFYKFVSVASVDGSGFAVLLDGKPMKTPAGTPLVAPTKALAEGVAAEWDAQGETVKPAEMPLTQLLATALDRIPTVREQIVVGVAAYAETDLVCHRADSPQELAVRQAKAWQPLVEWTAERYGAALCPVEGVMPVDQPEEAAQAIRGALAALGDFDLCGVQNAASVCGSVVIALALYEGRVDAEEAFELSQLDETFQIEKWGEDAETTARRAQLKADIAATARWFAALGDRGDGT